MNMYEVLFYKGIMYTTGIISKTKTPHRFNYKTIACTNWPNTCPKGIHFITICIWYYIVNQYIMVISYLTYLVFTWKSDKHILPVSSPHNVSKCYKSMFLKSHYCRVFIFVVSVYILIISLTVADIYGKQNRSHSTVECNRTDMSFCRLWVHI